ncbi:hypothetical protein [Mycobacteroides abscessus]|uniref:hypothetical protein n=1 Tax=Mycobacteroides abscessus TaxID=36809 RepID=UPI00092C5754|nr:hypothetical protein [Mycobacteroides abscessus]MBE5408366.1 hypothetical protein [Mycobacteroides abscessus]MBE5433299.1 hypothetical protein [Mycobacteroides abscessus]MBE5502674.1 hypothetical protein [Mycobacteroides abscessus]MBN7428895.1 hypothetical protein [Mycobacteroides abscessus subsp. massiliense]MBN7468935.1 hypothetical protein [Mycobacteroides abscessus subsp. massiliense]
MEHSAVCPRCGAALPPEAGPRRGRRRVWCSQNCRRAAHAARANAEQGSQLIRVVEVPRSTPVLIKPLIVPRPMTSGEAAQRVLTDTDALSQVLRVLAARVRNGELPAGLAADARELARAIGTQTPTTRNDVSLVDQWLNEKYGRT